MRALPAELFTKPSDLASLIDFLRVYQMIAWAGLALPII
jgi:hypothetical protein